MNKKSESDFNLFALKDVLKDFVKDNKLEDGLDKVRVIEAWNKVIGTSLGGYVTNIDFNKGTLYVTVSSSVMRQELSYGIDKMISLLNEELQSDLIKKLILR